MEPFFYIIKKMKTLLIILFPLFVGVNITAQEVKHYQKKIELNQILLPYEKYNSDLFDIVFEDSLYSNANITVKKGKIKSIKKASCLIIVENNMYTVNSIQVKGKKKFELLKKNIGSILGSDISDISPGDYCHEVNGNNIKLRYQDMGRKKVLTLIKSECEAGK